MAKFMLQASYTLDGTKGLLRDGGSKRRAVVEKAVAALGGKVEAFYFSFGKSDVVIIVDLPDATTAVAVGLTVTASGSVNTVTTPLISAEDMDALFRPDGHYAEKPADWGDPEEALSRRRFFAVLEQCMQSLPKNTARAFAMREVMGLETDEICATLGISSSNCWVLLYRARMKLRECLERNWIGAGGR